MDAFLHKRTPVVGPNGRERSPDLAPGRASDEFAANAAAMAALVDEVRARCTTSCSTGVGRSTSSATGHATS